MKDRDKPTSDTPATQRERYEAPRIVQRRSLAKAILFSGGSGTTGTTGATATGLTGEG